MYSVPLSLRNILLIMNKLRQTLSNYKFTILFLISLVIIIYIPSYVFRRSMILTVFSFIPLLHICSKVKYTIIPSVILGFIVSVDMFFAVMYKERLTLGVLASIIETSPDEAFSVGSTIIIPALAILILLTILTFFSIKEFKRLKINILYSVVFLALFCFLYIPYIINKKIKQDIQAVVFYEEQSMFVAQIKASEEFPVMYKNIMTCMAYVEEMNTLKKFKNRDRTLYEGIERLESSDQPLKIYYILGESATRTHCSLYGYSRPTTPFLDSLMMIKSPELTYYKGLAPASITRNAIRFLFTYAIPSNLMPFYENKHLIEMAKDAGYETSWISAEIPKEIVEGYTGLIASSSDRLVLDTIKPLEDFNLIPLLEKSKVENKKQFFVIHLTGSHIAYADHFDNVDDDAIPGRELVDEYDKSIHHTDRVLRNIYNLAQQDSSYLIYYISDHGEIIGKAHGTLSGGIGQFEVPVVILNKSNLDINSIMPKYQVMRDSMVNTLTTSYILGEALGYRISDENIEKLKESSKYTFHVDGKVYLLNDI